MVIHNYLKANNVRYSNRKISQLADKLWRNESEEIKNEYKQLAKTIKCHEQSFKTETIDIDNVENPFSLGTTSDYPSTNTEPSLHDQFPVNTLNINLPPISVQTTNFQNSLIIIFTLIL